jgi:hypothetical protein
MRMATARGNRTKEFAACLCAGSLLLGLSGCFLKDAWNSATKETEQTEQPTKTTQPKRPTKAPVRTKVADSTPEPTQQELIEYVRGKLLALSPSDGFNDNLDVRFDPSSGTLTVIQPDGRCDHFLGSLDANNLYWDTFDPSDPHYSREELLRLTITSVSGKAARACFDKKGQPQEGTSTNRVRLLFSLEKSEQFSGFKGNMAKAMRKLIVLSGGAPENEIFPEPKSKQKQGKK